MLVDSPAAIDVETFGSKPKEAKDCRTAKFICAAVAPHGVVTFNKPEVRPGAKVIVHNIPYDPVVLGVWDAEWDDTKVKAHLAGLPDTTLKGLQTRLLGRPAYTYDQAQDEGKVPEYNLYDAVNTWDLFPAIKLKPGPQRLYDELEKPLLPLWAKMTLEGSFRLDGGALAEYRDVLAEEVDYLLECVHADLPEGRTVTRCTKCGLLKEDKEKGQKCEDGKNHSWETSFDPDARININSPVAQLLPALQSLGLAVKDTGADTLRLVEGQHPVIRSMLDYREKFKEKSTYIDPWWGIAAAGKLLGSIWRPTGAWTGRVSSAGPNLQNVPKHLERFFLAPKEGYELLTFDNAQLEVRIAAHISQDPALIAACQSGDLHAEMQELYGLPNRRAAKVGTFGTMYLGGPGVILDKAREYGVPMTWKEAEQLQALVYARMPDYFRWAHSIAEERVIEGLFGRIHNVPPGGEDYHQDKQAVNSPIQGGAGDVCKYQMRDVWRAGYWVVRQVHDSLTAAVPRADVEDARVDIPRIMEGAAPELDVPIVVEEA